jgi:predicted amidophosphoribosyltransferase
MPEAGTDASNFKLPPITPGPNCAKCQGALPADAKFCHQCGTPTLPVWT